MKVLISGSNGMIGSVVAPYQANQGHEVIRLVRQEPKAGEARWDPDAGSIDPGTLEGFDGVVQLASMPWPMRWNAKFKQQMLDNRIARMQARPSNPGFFAKALGGRNGRCDHPPQPADRTTEAA